jgi:sigma-E factor negative regulatory protein RseB
LRGIRVKTFFSLLFLLGVPQAEAATKTEKTPISWIEDMAYASREANFDVTYTYLKGISMHTVRAIHMKVNGEEKERRFNLSGENRELYREGKSVSCVHSEFQSKENITLERCVASGPFSSAFPERIMKARNLYNFSLLPKSRIIDRTAMQMSISPKFDDRYGYVVWIDEKSGLLLKSVLTDRGRAREVFQIVRLKLGDQVDESDLESRIQKDGYVRRLYSEPRSKKSKPIVTVNWLPSGFKSVRRQGNRLHFTDGLANVSVFVNSHSSDLLPDLATSSGGTVLLTMKLKQRGQQITVVGNVPMKTARRVAESVEPVVY